MKKRQSVKTKMIEFRNPYHVEPPGALREILSHPINQSEAGDLAIFQEHRYAFFIGTNGCEKMLVQINLV